MFMHSSRCFAAMVLLSIVAMPARAQWAVIDAPAIVQLVHQVATMEQQLQTTHVQLTQAQAALHAMTGNRGMESLLSGTSRNYLPSSWSQLTYVLHGGLGAYGGAGAYAGLSSDVRAAIGINAVLSPQQLSLLAPVEQQQIIATRESTALQQALAQAALANASGRFASLQTLIAAISAAGDQKAILDLQARIGAEVGMLQNEQSKLLILQQAARAQEAVNEQRQREQIIAGHGRFESRFQPVP